MFKYSTSSVVRRQRALALAFFCLLNALALPGLQRSDAQGFGTTACGTEQSFEGTAFALTTNNTLLNFNPGTPNLINSARFISGLSTGESIIAIDFRPATGQLFGLSNTSRLYLINPSTGTALPVGSALSPTLNGNLAGFDFNPAVDRIRLVGGNGQNLRINPITGAVVGTDTNLVFAAGDVNASRTPNLTSVAYTNSSAGVTATTLYGIDPTLDVLVLQGSVNGTPVSPNTGQLTTVGPLGIDVTDVIGFDIIPGTNAAFATFTTQGGTASQLYSINLTTGAATAVGTFGGGQLIRDLAFSNRTENIYALACESNTLLRLNAGAPGSVLSSVLISGLAANEKLVGIDFRPATGQLYAVSNTNRIYTINTTTGAATVVGTTAFTPTLSGTGFGVDFNPAVDRIRVISNNGQNLRLNPITGAVAGTDTNLAFASGDANAGQTANLVSVAYTNNFVGATSTTLYGIDANGNLVTVGSVNGTTSPNGGQLFTVGSLGFDPTDTVGFDVSPVSGAAFAAFSVANGTSQLYSINLQTGAATALGNIGSGLAICDIAIEVASENLQPVFGITASNMLVNLNAGTPGTINSSRSISGLQSGETIVGTDVRPATGELYALTSAGRLYTINQQTGVATLVSAAALTPALSGTVFSFNFNPTVDRIRVTSNTGQNLRINPTTGAVVGTDTNLAFASGDPNASNTPNLLAVAYTNSFLGAGTTTLYGIDASGNLVTVGSVNGTTSPNGGQVFTVGSLGVTLSGQVGFDIAPGNNAGFLTVTPSGGGASQLYSVNLTTGAATLIGAAGVTDPIRILAVGGQTNSASRVSSFLVCLQDDQTGDNLQINTCSGDYQFTRCGSGNFTLTGRGSIGRSGNFITVRDARVNASIDTRLFGTGVRNTGTATIKVTIFGPSYFINDNGGGSNSSCGCR